MMQENDQQRVVAIPIVVQQIQVTPQQMAETAVKNDDISALNEITKAGISLNSIRFDYKENLLHYAVKNKAKRIVTYLVENKLIDVNETQENRFTPLIYALRIDEPEVARLLIENGAKFIGKELYYAIRRVRHNLVEFIEYLLSKGASTFHAKGTTPLHAAASRANRELFDFFLGQGQNIKARDAKGNTVLHRVFSRRHPVSEEKVIEMVDYLVSKGCDLNAKDNDSCTLMDKAINLNYKDVIIHLLDNHKFNVNTKHLLEHTLLHDASSSGRLEIMKVLLDRGADIEAKDAFNNTPLLNAATSVINSNKFESIALLLDYGADYKKTAHWIIAGPRQSIYQALNMGKMTIFEERFRENIDNGKTRKKANREANKTSFWGKSQAEANKATEATALLNNGQTQQMTCCCTIS